jgi:hypothetical protein
MVIQHKQLFVTAWTWLRTGVYWVIAPVRWLVCRVIALFQGKTITDSSQSIVDFEKGFSEKEVHTITEDEFWRAFLTDIATRNEEEQHNEQSDTIEAVVATTTQLLR